MASLTNATSPTVGTATDFIAAKHQVRMVVTTTGQAAALSVNLESSLDNSTWKVVSTSTSVTGDTVMALDGGARYWRANLTALSTVPGGTAPTVSAAITPFGPY